MAKMKNSFRNLPIRQKLLISYSTVFLLSFLIGSIVIYLLVTKTIESNLENQLNNQNDVMLRIVKSMANNAIKKYLRKEDYQHRDIVINFYQSFLAANLSEEIAKKRAAQILRNKTIGRTGFLFVIDIQNMPNKLPIVVYPKMQGTDAAKIDFLQKAAELKDGYMEYFWQTPEESKPLSKALYVTYFEPWHWLIGATSNRKDILNTLDLGEFKQQITGLRFSKSGYNFILDSAGNIVAHPYLTGNQYYLEDDSHKLYIQEMCTHKNGKITFVQKGTSDSRLGHNLAVFNYLEQFDWIVGSAIYLDALDSPMKNIRNGLLATLFITLLMVMLLTMRISSQITKPFTSLKERFELGAFGDFSVRMQSDSMDEIGQLAPYFNSFMEKLEENSRSLKQEIIERKEAERQLSIQNALKTGQMELNEKIRGDQDIVTLGQKIISYLAKYLHAHNGAIYIMEDDQNLNLVSTYAGSNDVLEKKSFNLGEGLVGQTALDKRHIILTQCPEGCMPIVSGMNHFTPNNILIYPLLLHDKVTGVVELSSLNAFDDVNIDFLHQISESIAVSIKSSLNHSRMAELLEQTQNLANKLQSQQIELQNTNEELKAQTQLLEEQKKNIENKNIELEKAQHIIQEKARDVEMASRYKSEFLANMSHELRTPLNSILLLSKLLLDDQNNRLSAKQIEFAETIHASGADLLTLINEILDLSKVEAGKMEIFVTEVKLETIGQKMERYFKSLANEKGVRLNITLEKNLPKVIRTDSQRLDQVLKNLLSNAFKFTPSGAVELKIYRPELDFKPTGNHLAPETSIAFAVIDTGIGIPKASQKLIFEAFKQVDGTTSRKYEGTGLGLSISKELAKLLKGEIHLESETGKGSTFILYLPEKIGKYHPHPAAPPLTADQNSAQTEVLNQMDQIRVETNAPESVDEVLDDRRDISAGDKVLLVISEDPKFVIMTRDSAEAKGYKVLICSDGETGLHFVDYYSPHAVFLDLQLSGTSGWAVLSRLKSNLGLRHIPIICMSDKNNLTEALKMGAAGGLQKPVKELQVSEIISRFESMIERPIKNLLLIEADTAFAEKFLTLIGNGNLVMTVCTSGEQALQKIKEIEFDTILLNLVMPDMPVIDFLSQIHDSGSSSHIPTIAYTDRELKPDEKSKIEQLTRRIIFKSTSIHEVLLDKVSLFMHRNVKYLTQKQIDALSSLHDQKSSLKDKSVLIVDDDMRSVFALTSILEENQMFVNIGKNGRHGMEVLKKNPKTDLILMDISMPIMDGYEAMGEIRKQEQFKHLPIIALTAKAMKGDRIKCIEAGANDYLAKPINKDKLISMLRVWLYH